MKLNLTFFTPSTGRDMGVFIGGEEDLHRKLEAVWSTWTVGWPTFSAFTDFGHHRPTPPISLDTCMKRF
jgi:hypothetical protein